MRLFPALISASSSELSPVGDIMLKDFVPMEKEMEPESEMEQKQRLAEVHGRKRVRQVLGGDLENIGQRLSQQS